MGTSSRSKAPTAAAAALSVALIASASVVPAWGALTTSHRNSSTLVTALSAKHPSQLNPSADGPFPDPSLTYPGAVDAQPEAPSADGNEPLQPNSQLDSGIDPARLNERLDGIVTTAKTLIGRPYVWGGTTPAGIDCSGFAGFVYSRYNIKLPRTAEEQFHAVNQISRQQARPGDLVFFPRSDGFVYHVAIYAGGGMIVEARNPRVGVLLDPIWAPNVTFGTVRSLGHRPGGYITGRYNPQPISTGVGFTIGSWNGSAAGTTSYAWIDAPSKPKTPTTTPPSATRAPTPTPTPSPKPTPTPSPGPTPTPTPTPTTTRASPSLWPARTSACRSIWPARWACRPKCQRWSSRCTGERRRPMATWPAK